MSAPKAPIDHAMRKATEAIAEQMEWELLGSWRAGYDWLHVYEENPMHNVPLGGNLMEEALTITQYVYPSDSERPRLLEHDGVIYRHSYDLRDITKEQIDEVRE